MAPNFRHRNDHLFCQRAKLRSILGHPHCAGWHAGFSSMERDCHLQTTTAACAPLEVLHIVISCPIASFLRRRRCRRRRRRHHHALPPPLFLPLHVLLAKRLPYYQTHTNTLIPRRKTSLGASFGRVKKSFSVRPKDEETGHGGSNLVPAYFLSFPFYLIFKFFRIFSLEWTWRSNPI
ncbi:hypothetical protein LZ32DRAFT_327756 [Colletotrichum eremochloae]|nr:hypothetical protein LZ32DRAFT_327756 [Colletotrichum eremochloae]